MYNPQGSRKRGKPRNSWWRSTLAEGRERSWREPRPIARDRRKWKNSQTTYVPDGTMGIINYRHPSLSAVNWF
jgi:hypothetical protein